jgi:hypothetical protein
MQVKHIDNSDGTNRLLLYNAIELSATNQTIKKFKAFARGVFTRQSGLIFMILKTSAL